MIQEREQKKLGIEMFRANEQLQYNEALLNAKAYRVRSTYKKYQYRNIDRVKDLMENQ